MLAAAQKWRRWHTSVANEIHSLFVDTGRHYLAPGITPDLLLTGNGQDLPSVVD